MTTGIIYGEEDLFDMIASGRFKMVGYSNSFDELESMLENLYIRAGKTKCGDEIKKMLVDISKRTFTKKGEYYITIVGDTKTGDVFLFVTRDEIRLGKNIILPLKCLKYVPKWFGIFGYRIVGAD